MPILTLPLRRIGQVMADQVARLHASLERLTGEVRAALARAVGQATGEAVREALRVILDGPPERPNDTERAPDREGVWGQPRRPTWPATHSYGPYSRSPYERDPDDEYEDQPHRRYAADAMETQEDAPIAVQRQGNWSRAVATGCQAASWWLRRHPGPFALVTAAGIGIAAGVATLVSSPLMAGVSAVAASALGILTLADAARSAAGLANQAMK